MVDLENDPLLLKDQTKNQISVLVESCDQYESINDDVPLSQPSLGILTSFTGFWSVPSVAVVSGVYVMLALSTMSASVQQYIVFNKACESNMVDGKCNAIDNQILVASYQQMNEVIRKVCLIIALTFIGRLSDLYGRKPLIFATAASYFISLLIYTYATYFCYGLKLKTLLFASFVRSTFGDLSACISLVNSYICDITTLQNRKTAMSQLIAVLFIFQTVGQFVGSMILAVGKTKGYTEEENEFIPLFGSLGLAFLLVLYCTVLPESLSKQEINQLPAIDFKAFSFESVQKSLKHQAIEVVGQIKLLGLPDEYIPENLKPKSKELRHLVLLLAAFLIFGFVVEEGLGPVLIQYTIYKFKWDAEAIANFIMVSSISSSFVLVVVFPYVNNVIFAKVLGFKYLEGQLDSADFFTISLSIVSEILGNIFIGLSQTTTQIFTAVCLSSFQATLIPCLNSAITKFYPNSKTAEVLMCIGFLTNVAGLVIPPLYLQLYKYSLGNGHPEFGFFVTASIYTVLLGVLWYSFLVRKRV